MKLNFEYKMIENAYTRQTHKLYIAKYQIIIKAKNFIGKITRKILLETSAQK
jgi:hypothetical protein